MLMMMLMMMMMMMMMTMVMVMMMMMTAIGQLACLTTRVIERPRSRRGKSKFGDKNKKKILHQRRRKKQIWRIFFNLVTNMKKKANLERKTNKNHIVPINSNKGNRASREIGLCIKISKCHGYIQVKNLPFLLVQVKVDFTIWFIDENGNFATLEECTDDRGY